MLLKWITCDVAPDFRDAFHLAQLYWRAIAPLDGFLGQAGGWSAQHAGRACILAFWRDWLALDAFMHREHDAIVERSLQSQTYTASRVIATEIDSPVPAHVLATSNTIQVSACTIDFIGDIPMQIDTLEPLDDDVIRVESAWLIQPRRSADCM